MKKIISTVFVAFVAASIFAQNDFQPLAVVKLNQSETINLKQLKQNIQMAEKQAQRSLTVEERMSGLTSLIQQKLILQAAAKEGFSISDSQVNAAFLQSMGVQTEAQANEAVKAQTGLSLDEYCKKTAGMTLAEYKKNIKDTLTVQQYVVAKKQNEAKGIQATADEVKDFYKMNKKSFSRDDSAKVFIYVHTKTGNDTQDKADTESVRIKIKDNKKEISKILSGSGKKYQASEILIEMNETYARRLGWTSKQIMELFEKEKNYVSDVISTDTDFQFYVIEDKYPAKMLELTDEVSPGSGYTVYDYIRENITNQKQGIFLQKALMEIAVSLDTPQNVDRKKTDEELKKLLNW